MNEKIASTVKSVKEAFGRSKDKAMNKLAGFSKKQLIVAGSSVVTIVIVAVAVIVVSGNGTNNNDNQMLAKNVEVENAQAYAIAVDGKNIVYVATEDDAKAVLDGIVDRYKTAGATLVDTAFAEAVTYKAEPIVTKEQAKHNKRVTETYICKADEAVNYIANGTATPTTYTVQGGDTLWDIAAASNISVYELEQMNPGAADNLKVGQALNLYQVNPFVHVTLTETVVSTERMAYDTKYESSNALYKGQVQVQSAGSYGSKEVTTQIKKQNGAVIESVVVGENITTEPVTQIALQGTKTMPVTAGSGQFQSPVGCIDVCSGYGSSRGGGSRRHAGVDLKAGYGAPIMASDSGTVTFSGWSGGSYGYLVKISHGNGVETRYAHCSSVVAAAGQSVTKGQVIAYVGSSGNATGNLVHFEVRVNGAAKNPMNYL